ncbi:HAD family hydrolase [Myxococcus vastator]|uniref:HAD family hydrolase n=1 Tax=Myxococcus vastator TaxID=2709664 RepID=UPI0013CFB446|nr:HAD hydrolase-like protein [Myxococcus vastator]
MSRLPYAHVVFDWNGTLLDDLTLAVHGVNHVLGNHGRAPITADQYRANFHFPIQSFYASLGFDFEAIPFSQIVSEYLSIFDARVPDCPLHEDVHRCLTRLKAEQLDASILSASHQDILSHCVSGHRLTDYFRFTMGLSDNHAVSKVEQGRALSKRLGLAPEKVLYIGDTTHDADVAKANGWSCILVSQGHQHRDRLEATGWPVVECLEAAFPFMETTGQSQGEES